MKYNQIVEGTFVKRINRFIASVLINNEEILVHVKNTGRCKELFIEGAKVYIEKSDNLNRKTAYSLISIYKNDLLINIDSQVPNAVVHEGILEGKISELSDIIKLKREVSYGKSRFDLYYETPTEKGFIEVKGVTLECSGIARFPDAPTDRGRKHIYELIEASKVGYTNYLFFLIQMNNIYSFEANWETDPKFAEALELAKQHEIKVLVFNSIIDKNSIYMNNRLF